MQAKNEPVFMPLLSLIPNDFQTKVANIRSKLKEKVEITEKSLQTLTDEELEKIAINDEDAKRFYDSIFK